ncbi:MAG: hypothetical protein AVDCRST_MAG73-307 [uncultured Thermomicrobiales bacterium]|uniref:Uncharacterized protein n=1 Tax=uncultured Thermomicrobiales bacterium TaxID=1645740 RepID=A0A6J4TI65_9BACT|nr:MAG: hypothetical protein AVDCRST_MAG73-307 [uncultured Thermomicrobiales bacterium]
MTSVHAPGSGPDGRDRRTMSPHRRAGRRRLDNGADPV